MPFGEWFQIFFLFHGWLLWVKDHFIVVHPGWSGRCIRPLFPALVIRNFRGSTRSIGSHSRKYWLQFLDTVESASRLVKSLPLHYLLSETAVYGSFTLYASTRKNQATSSPHSNILSAVVTPSWRRINYPMRQECAAVIIQPAPQGRMKNLRELIVIHPSSTYSLHLSCF